MDETTQGAAAIQAAAPPHPGGTDEALAARIATGDRDAFAALYERHFEGLYDFALRVVGDREAAADIVQNTFVKAWSSFGKRPVEHVKAWLYAVARNEAMDEFRRRKRLAPAGEAPPEADPLFTQVDESRLADPEAVAGDRELVELVWSSAAALSPQEYSLLDMHLRRGLGADELAAALGLAKGAVYTRLSRLKDALEEAVSSTILLRRGGGDCPALRALLAALDATEPTRDVRRAIQGHRDECDRCREATRRPLEIFAGLAAVPASPGLRETLLERISAEAEAAGPAGGSGGRGTLALAAGSAVALLAAAVAGGALYTSTRAAPPVEDPADIRSTTHTVGVASSDTRIRLVWTPEPGARGYSIAWSRDRRLPDTESDLPGTAGETEFEAAPGRWWFVLRTEGGEGDWTSTEYVGPFVIVGPPRAEITAGPAGPSAEREPSFAFASAAPGATFECALDGAAFQACASPSTFGPLEDGAHELRVRARDGDGNAGEPAVRAWTVDTRPPDTSLRGPRGWITTISATFRIAGPDPQCRLDGPWRPCDSPVRLAGLAQGRHTFRARSRDAAGNVDPTPARRVFAVDSRPPDTRIAAAELTGPDARFVVEATERRAALFCRLDGGRFGRCDSPRVFAGLPPGPHTFEVRARDRAGNVDPTPASRRWVVSLPPDTEIRQRPPSLAASASASIGFSASDGGVRFECALDGGTWRGCSSPLRLTGLGQGRHTLRVRALTDAGGPDPTPAATSWTVDTIAPSARIDHFSQTGPDSVTFAFRASEREARLQCRVDGGSWHACTSPRQLTGLAHGAHTFRVRAVDRAGNIGPPASRTFNL